MICLQVEVPFTSFRKPYARNFLETEDVPPISTCYGFLLSFVGEVDRRRHIGARVTTGLIRDPNISKILCKRWRHKNAKESLGNGQNRIVDYQYVLSNGIFAIVLDSSDESKLPTLEERFLEAYNHPERVNRFGTLCLGENRHIVESVKIVQPSEVENMRLFAAYDTGKLCLSVWPDYRTNLRTVWINGDLVSVNTEPDRETMPMIVENT